MRTLAYLFCLFLPFASWSCAIFDSTHCLKSIGPKGNFIELEDHSGWEIRSGDVYKLLSWNIDDSLVIIPNYDWFSKGAFYITNQMTGSSARADLVVSPIAFGAHSHWIIGMDPIKGKVYLENGTCWLLNSNDYFLYRKWVVNDHIILGTNDSLFSYFDRILINFNRDSYVRAKQY